MNIRLIGVGKVRERYLAAAIDDFRRRLTPYHRLEEIDLRSVSGTEPARAVARESTAILEALKPGEDVWLLERSGLQFSSDELSKRLDQLTVGGTSQLTIVVAGTHGVNEAVMARANVLWSLSRLTFLHEWARAIVFEQLYRAAKISRGEPYHH